MGIRKALLISLAAGIVITLITGLIDAGSELVGISNHGFPFAWLSTLMLPNPITSIEWINFILDVAVWSFAVFLLLELLKR